MTRINLVPCEELTDQHLFAEFREIKMVPGALFRALKTKSVEEVLASIPNEFTLGAGHVKFFYDKGTYLRTRYSRIRMELFRRGINYNVEAPLDKNHVYSDLRFCRAYLPTPEALAIVRERINQRILEKPQWYRINGQSMGT